MTKRDPDDLHEEGSETQNMWVLNDTFVNAMGETFMAEQIQVFSGSSTSSYL